jgi:hypothetical protein
LCLIKRILNAKFKTSDGPICSKDETINSIIETSPVPKNFIRNREPMFFEGAKNYAINQASHHTLNNDDEDDDNDGRQRLWRA